ncbi:S-adenosyl-L-methionine-dependent methyltransferase, partial [Atractiella rhizophila]
NGTIADWDSNAATRLSSSLFFNHLSTTHSSLLTPTTRVLELGCGTGLLSTLVAPGVGFLLGVEMSEGMMAKFNEKAEKVNGEDHNGGKKRMEGTVMLLERKEQVMERWAEFDVVLSHLVFHHIPSLSAILSVLFSILKPGGHLLVSDFELTEWSRSFHPESKMEGVERHGLDKAEMTSLFVQAGFGDVSVTTAFEVEKEVESGGKRRFPFVVCVGRKPGSSG